MNKTATKKKGSEGVNSEDDPNQGRQDKRWRTIWSRRVLRDFEKENNRKAMTWPSVF
jgi:hypothetical protein